MARLEVWNLDRRIMGRRCEERGVGIPLWGACARGVSFRRRGDQLHYWEMLLFYMLIDGGLIALRSLAASQIGLGGITIRMDVKSLLDFMVLGHVR